MRQYPLARTARRVTFKFQTHDVRKYAFADAVERARRAVTRAGGELLGGTFAPKKHIRRWCVNRSPHVNKTSREHFWMITHKRVFRWDAGADVDLDAPDIIAQRMPQSVAVRVTEERPGLMALAEMWETMEKVGKKPKVEKSEESEHVEEEKVENLESS